MFSMVRRARLMGFLMSLSKPVAPARRVSPSIMEASISMCLSMVSVEPRPALKTGLSSMLLTAASTASNAVPLGDFRMRYPALAAVFTPSIPAFLLSGCHAPAPPCTITTGFCIVEVASFVLREEQ